MHGQEIGREVERFDQCQLFIHLGDRALWRAFRVAGLEPLPRQSRQSLLGRLIPCDLVWIIVTQLGQAKARLGGELHRAAQSGRMAGKEPLHIGCTFEAALGIGQRAGADVIDGNAVAQTGQYIGQLAA